MRLAHYVHEHQDLANAQRAIDDFAGEMIGQITEDAWGSQLRAGSVS
jgi:phosphotriesterase-related protein